MAAELGIGVDTTTTLARSTTTYQREDNAFFCPVTFMAMECGPAGSTGLVYMIFEGVLTGAYASTNPIGTLSRMISTYPRS